MTVNSLRYVQLICVDKVMDTGGLLRDKVNQSYCPSLFVCGPITLQSVADTAQTVLFTNDSIFNLV